MDDREIVVPAAADIALLRSADKAAAMLVPGAGAIRSLMDNDAAYLIRDPPGTMIICNETAYNNSTPERIPGQPDNFARQAQIVEGSGPRFCAWSREGALELDLVVVGTKPLNNSSPAR